jgi:hypothetical protein
MKGVSSMKCFIVRPVSTTALSVVAAMVLGGCSPNAGSTGAPNGAAVAVDQVHLGGVHSDVCGEKEAEPVDPSGGGFKLGSCAGRGPSELYGFNVGLLTYGKNNGSGARVTWQSYKANPSAANCQVTSGVAYAWFTATATTAVTFTTTPAQKSEIRNQHWWRNLTGNFTLYASSQANGVVFSAPLGSVHRGGDLEFTSPFIGQTLPASLLCFSVAKQ